MENITKLIAGIGSLILLVVISLAIVSYASDVQTTVSTTGAFDTNFSYNNSAITIDAKNGITAIDVIKYNQTWLEFDGEGNITIEPTNSINVSGNITISFWINFTKNGTDIMSKWLATNHQRSWAFDMNNEGGTSEATNITFRFANGSDSDSVTTIGIMNDSKWHYIVGQWNGTQASIWVDGVLNNTRTPATLTGQIVSNSTSELFIGKSRITAFDYNGSIDDVRILNYSVKKQQIRRVYNESDYGNGLGKSIPVLSYHQVNWNDTTANTIRNITKFNQEMSWLYHHGYETITYDDYYSWRIGNGTIPEKPIMIVFDDGWKSILTNASSTMYNYSFVGVMNVITSYPSSGNPSYMTWDDLQNLSNDGWQIASHSVNHGNFVTTYTTVARRKEELSNSSRHIQGNLSITPTMFYFPFNSNNITTDSECAINYTMCGGYSSGGSVRAIYLFKRANLTHEDGLPKGIGLKRWIVYNTTNLSDLINYVDYDTSDILNLQFSENQGTTAYDISGKSNNGDIDGANYDNDGILLNLTEDIDYTIDENFGVFTLLGISEYYNWIKISWTSSWITDDSVTDMVGNFTSGINNVSKKIPNILLIGAIIAILGILFMLWKFSDKMGLNMGDSL